MPTAEASTILADYRAGQALKPQPIDPRLLSESEPVSEPADEEDAMQQREEDTVTDLADMMSASYNGAEFSLDLPFGPDKLIHFLPKVNVYKSSRRRGDITAPQYNPPHPDPAELFKVRGHTAKVMDEAEDGVGDEVEDEADGEVDATEPKGKIEEEI